ncbi:GGDEF domain-containing protein [Deferrisoma camini]|uniref:GGDEF domain-containing protein n=1 Tax=Deferrisoma camini TaxID=1035120 RepID=UPI00046D4AC6|nr:GGDEF domain-containing protein [Deferrisoma camini]
MESPNLPIDSIPPELAPAAWALLAEIARRIPPFLGQPPRVLLEQAPDGTALSEALAAFLAWLETAPAQWGTRMEELEALFGEMGAVVGELDGRVRRFVQHARRYATEHEGLTASVEEALGRLDAGLVDDAFRPALEPILRTLRSEAVREQRETRRLEEEAGLLRDLLGGLRERLGQVENKVRALRTQSLRDPLTGLWNRGAWDDRLAEETARAVRYLQPFSVILWDVDRFKEVNDRHGHPTGDLVLQALAGRTLQALRRSDFVARYGGEEFAVLLPHTEGDAARIVAEKLRRLAETAPIRTQAGPVRVTLSVGVATWQPGEDEQALVQRADDALYQAKRAGRNRVMAAQSPSGQPKKAAQPA